MQMKKRLLISAAVMLALSSAGNVYAAETTTGTLNVSFSKGHTCTVAVTSKDFGDLTAITADSGAETAPANIAVSCTQGTLIESTGITISDGTVVSGVRQLVGVTNSAHKVPISIMVPDNASSITLGSSTYVDGSCSTYDGVAWSGEAGTTVTGGKTLASGAGNTNSFQGTDGDKFMQSGITTLTVPACIKLLHNDVAGASTDSYTQAYTVTVNFS